MSEPQRPAEPADPIPSAEEPAVHPGPRDEGGEGGMATRELHARHEEDDEPS